MTLTLNITDDLKPDELGEMVDAAREEGKSLGALVLEASREYVSKRRASRMQTATAETRPQAA